MSNGILATVGRRSSKGAVCVFVQIHLEIHFCWVGVQALTCYGWRIGRNVTNNWDRYDPANERLDVSGESEKRGHLDCFIV